MDRGHAWYRLAQVEGLGPKRLHAIRRTFAAANRPLDDIFGLDLTEFHRLLPMLPVALHARIQTTRNKRVDREYRALHDEGIEVVHPDHVAFPAALSARLGDAAPPLLYCGGALGLLASDAVAIVGSRHASPDGLAAATTLAIELAALGQNVISGYAPGTDTAAHLGALRAGGTTTIVLSTGIREFAPKHDIAPLLRGDNALVVSQFPPAAGWNAQNAMARNKVVCALARALIVVEAGPERDERGRMSGTFDAGKAALGMGVPVFVLDPAAFSVAPLGNTGLLALGGTPLREVKALGQLLGDLVPAPVQGSGPKNLRLF